MIKLTASKCSQRKTIGTLQDLNEYTTIIWTLDGLDVCQPSRNMFCVVFRCNIA